MVTDLRRRLGLQVRQGACQQFSDRGEVKARQGHRQEGVALADRICRLRGGKGAFGLLNFCVNRVIGG